MKRCEIEYDKLKTFDYILSIDEAGRGPLAGPVTIAGILVNKNMIKEIDSLEYLNDSKKVTKKRRIQLEHQIKMLVKSYEICNIDVDIIDSINIYEGTKIGIINVCRKILEHNILNNVCILIDGIFKNIEIMFKEFINIKYELICIPHGDLLCPTISAASILAKEHRDKLMEEMDLIYPMYGFKNHKGYGSKLHIQNLMKYGSCKIHRKSFSPVKLYPEKIMVNPDFQKLIMTNSKKFEYYYNIGKNMEKDNIEYKSYEKKIAKRVVRYIDIINESRMINQKIKVSDISQMKNIDFENLLKSLKIENTI